MLEFCIHIHHFDLSLVNKIRRLCDLNNEYHQVT